jgi:uncharacterized Zn finger protein
MDVVRLVREGNIVVAVVRGDSGNLHVVNVDLDVMEATCTCEAYEYRKECKHVVHVLSKLFVEA